MNKLPISVAIITRDEEDRITPCLKSVSFAQEIVIVDSGSKDSTLEIAARFGCRIFIHEWLGYARQKAMAIELCKHNWVLSLDADEEIPEETKDAIAHIITAPQADAYTFPRKNIWRGKWIKHGGWWPDRVLRLFYKAKAKVLDLDVHESIAVDGRIAHLQCPIIHRGITNLEQVIGKINVYSTLGSKRIHMGSTVSAITGFLHGLWAFFHTYIFRAGFLDGYEGFVLSYSHGVNTCYKYLKAGQRNYKE